MQISFVIHVVNQRLVLASVYGITLNIGKCQVTFFVS